MRASRKGFTLIEIIIVIIILGVLTAIAIPSYNLMVLQGAASAAQNNLLIIAGAEKNYYFKNSGYCTNSGPQSNCGDTLPDINKNLSLNISDNYYSYAVNSSTGSSQYAYCCTATSGSGGLAVIPEGGGGTAGIGPASGCCAGIVGCDGVCNSGKVLSGCDNQCGSTKVNDLCGTCGGTCTAKNGDGSCPANVCTAVVPPVCAGTTASCGAAGVCNTCTGSGACCSSSNACSTNDLCNQCGGSCTTLNGEDCNGGSGNSCECTSGFGSLGSCLSSCINGQCNIGGVLYRGCAVESRTRDCDICNPSVNPNGWTQIPDGTSCGSDGTGPVICDAGQCTDLLCYIGGAFYVDGVKNPSNQCQTCNHLVSTSSWTNDQNGGNCSQAGGDICYDGTCQLGCWVNNVPMGSNVFNPPGPNPLNTCESCNPSVSHTSWQSLPPSTPCTASGVSGTCSNLNICT